jgi:hypothetical protein
VTRPLAQPRHVVQVPGDASAVPTDTDTEISLQIVIKTINNSAGPDGIIPILLVFGAYPRINNNSVLSPTITKRNKAIRKASNKMRKYYAKQYINNIFRIKNSPNIIIIL